MKPKPPATTAEKRVTKGKHPNPIIFRLSTEQHSCLLEHAGETGVNEWAKEAVLRAMEQGEETAALAERLASVEALLAKLRRELRISVHGLLIASSEGKKLTPKQVDQWVESTLGDA